MSHPEEVQKILANQLPTDCHNYCKHITELFLGEISPTIFNKKLCVERCIKHRIAKIQLKLNEEPDIKRTHTYNNEPLQSPHPFWDCKQ